MFTANDYGSIYLRFFEALAGKSEIRISKSETNSKHENEKARNKRTAPTSRDASKEGRRIGGFWRFVFGHLRGALEKKMCKNAQIGVRNARKRGKNRPKRVETSPKHRKTSAFLAFFFTFEEAKTGLIGGVPATSGDKVRCSMGKLGLFFRGPRTRIFS